MSAAPPAYPSYIDGDCQTPLPPFAGRRLGDPHVDAAAVRWLSGLYGRLYLRADDDTLVLLEVARIKRRVLIAVAIDGVYPRWQFAKAPADLPADMARWMRLRSKFVHNKEQRDFARHPSAMAILGVSAIDPDARVYWLEGFWPTPQAAISHATKSRPLVLDGAAGEIEMRERQRRVIVPKIGEEMAE